MVPQAKLGGVNMLCMIDCASMVSFLTEGGIGIFSFVDLASVWFGFWFLHFKTAVFRFWGLPRFAGFLKFSLWFSVFVNNDGGLSDSFVQCVLQFFCFFQGSYTPQSR